MGAHVVGGLPRNDVDRGCCLLPPWYIRRQPAPLIYGGGHKAFRRLQEDIACESDLTIFFWSSELMPRPQYRPKIEVVSQSSISLLNGVVCCIKPNGDYSYRLCRELRTSKVFTAQ